MPTAGVAGAAGAAAGLHANLFAGHAAGNLAGLHAINTFLVRIGFDLLRSHKFHEAVRTRLQTKLANIVVPHYITPLRLEKLDLGTVPIMIKSAHSLPSPEPALIPRLVMHVVYSGQCKIVVQTNVDLKESPGYINFDKALEVFGTPAAGGSPAASPAAESAALAPAVPPAAPGSVAGEVPDEANGAPPSFKRNGAAQRGYHSIKNLMSGGAPALPRMLLRLPMCAAV